MKVFKKIIFNVIALISKFIGKIRVPFSKKECSFSDVKDILNVIKMGDIILTRTKGELSTLAIPGFWKHSAIYVGDENILDATDNGVNIRSIYDLIIKTDDYSVLRLNEIKDGQGELIVNIAKEFLGKKYDYKLEVNNSDEVFCSEIVYVSINRLKGKGYLDLRDRMGFDSFTPNDIYSAVKKFNLIIKN